MAKAHYKPRLGHDIRIKPDGEPAPAVKVRPCAIDGCREEGAYRVPKSRDALTSYLWLCLAHARAHNEKWDYFAGMSEVEIERFRSEANLRPPPDLAAGQARRRGLVRHDAGTIRSRTAMRYLQSRRHPARTVPPRAVL